MENSKNKEKKNFEEQLSLHKKKCLIFDYFLNNIISKI